MEENFSVISIEESGDQLQTSKKIKVRSSDFSVLVSQRSKRQIIEDNFGSISKDSFDLKFSENGSLDEKIDKKEELEKPKLEVVSPKKSNDEEYSFAYSGHKPEEDVTSDAIDEINEKLSKTYKEAPVEEKIVNVGNKEQKIKEKEITKDDFERILNTEENFSKKIINYKNTVRKKYDELNSSITVQQREIDGITSNYGQETEKGAKLQENKKEVQSTMNGINALDLNFLTDKKDDLSKSVLVALENLFNKNRELYNRFVQELKANADRKEELGKLEQKAREKLQQLKEDLNNFIKDNYPLVVKANKIDDAYKETSEEISELTGFDKEPVSEIDVNREPAQSVASIENLKEKRVASNTGSIPNVVGASDSSNSSLAYNRFESLREENEGLGFNKGRAA